MRDARRITARKLGWLFALVLAAVGLPYTKQHPFQIGEYRVDRSDLELAGGIAHADVPATGGDVVGGDGGVGGDSGGEGGGGDGGGDCP